MFLTRYFLIDFETAKVVIQKSLYERKDYKVIEFGDINSVEQQSVAFYSHEQEVANKYKFLIVTVEREYELFARTIKERRLWLEHFCRIIDVNNGLDIDFTRPSLAY